MPVSPLVVLSVLSGGLCLGSAWLVRRRWPNPGSGWFQVGAHASAVWSLGYGLGLLVPDPGLRRLFELPIWLGHGVAPVAFVLFVAAYTGRRAILDRSVVLALFVVPAITMLAVATNTEHGLMWTGYAVDPVLGAATVSYEKGAWLYVHKVYSYAVLLAAGAILLEVIVERGALYTVQAVMLSGVVGLLGAGSVVWVLGVGPYPQVTTTPLLFGWVFATAAAVFFRSPLFESPPAARRLGRQRLFAEFGDGVVVVDDEGRIVEANEAAEGLLGSASEGALVGRSIHSIDALATGDSESDPAASGGRPASSDGGHTTADSGSPVQSLPVTAGRHRVALTTESGRQPFEITVSPVTDDSGVLLGRTLLFQDVSQATRRRQQVSVLNRVLRHNLRNDLTVVRAYGEELADLDDQRHAEMAETIVAEADGLLSLGEQARTIEAALGEPDATDQSVELPELVEDVVAPYRDRAEIRVDVPQGIDIETDPQSLTAVLTAAVDNAVEHWHEPEGAETQRPTTGEPTVEVTASIRDDRASITVVDDGPGIPEHELEPIRAGTETDLEHGSGLGLWLITWGAGSLGGDVTFDAGQDRGTTVALRLPLTRGER